MIYFILPMGDRAFADELSTKIRSGAPSFSTLFYAARKSVTETKIRDIVLS